MAGRRRAAVFVCLHARFDNRLQAGVAGSEVNGLHGHHAFLDGDREAGVEPRDDTRDHRFRNVGAGGDGYRRGMIEPRGIEALPSDFVALIIPTWWSPTRMLKRSSLPCKPPFFGLARNASVPFSLAENIDTE